MVNFDYYTPTHVVFGHGAENQVGELVRAQGCQKALVHFGGQSAKKSGLLDRVFESLDAAGVTYITLGGVKPNPRLSLVREGIALCQKEKVDFILAVGGGSVIDSSKAIGYGVANPDVDVWQFYLKKQQPQGCLPVGCVLTIAAAGSEMSDSSVISNEETGQKRGCSNDLSRCRFAVMNPELTFSLPAYQTACGCVDILMHTMERYFTHAKHTQLTDNLAEGLMRTVIDNAPILMKKPDDYNARAEIMWAGSLSHNGLTGCGTTGDWACHQLEHEISAMFDVAHGAGLAAVWGSWARYVYQEEPARFAQFAVNVLGCTMDFSDLAATARAGIEKMEAFYQSIQMPIGLTSLGLSVSDKQIEKLAYLCSFENTRTIGGFRVLNVEDMEAIYRAARDL